MSFSSWAEPLATAQSDGSALTAAAAASCLPAHAKYTLPANFFSRIGQQLLIKATGRISSVVTTPGTARFDVRFGATVVFDSQAILLDTTQACTTQPWTLEILLTCRVVGSAAALFGEGEWKSNNVKGVGTMPVAGGVAMLPWNTAPANGNTFDGTASQQVDLFFTQTVATGSLTLHQYSLIALN